MIQVPYEVSQQMPLYEGEQYLALAQVNLLQQNEQTQEPQILEEYLYLVVTNIRVGFLGYYIKEAFFLQHIISVHLPGDLHVYWLAEQESFVHIQFKSEDDFENVFYIFSSLREKIVCERAQPILERAIAQMFEGQVSDALVSLEELKDVEEFHPAAHLLISSIYYHHSMKKKMMDVIFEGFRRIRSFDSFSLLFVLSTIPLSRSQIFLLSQAFSLEDDPRMLENFERFLAIIVLFQRGKNKEELSYLEAIFTESEPDTLLLGILFATYLFPLSLYGDIKVLVEKSVSRFTSFSETQDEEEKKLFEFLAHGPDYFAWEHNISESEQTIVKMLHILGQEPSPENYRFLESWEEIVRVVGEKLERERPSEENWKNYFFSIEDFEKIFLFINEVYSPYSPELIWALIRLGRLEDAKNKISAPLDWAKAWREMSQPTSSNSWIAALAAIELCLRQENSPIDKEQLTEFLNDAYVYILPAVKERSDIYLYYGTELHGFYQALLQQNKKELQAYTQLLNSKPHSGFSWVTSLVKQLLDVPVEKYSIDELPRLLHNFGAWFSNIGHSIGQDSQVQHQWNNLQKAQQEQHVRVVIAGETSSGKTSFINALLGEEILYITPKEATAVPTHIYYREKEWLLHAIDRQNNTLEVLQFYPPLGMIEKEKIKQFLEKYTSLDSKDSKQVACVWLGCPLKHIPQDVIFIDTPGLNAHGERTTIAKETVETAHACIFLLDGRNALKGKESKDIKQFANIVGKTLFVVNKIDLVIMASDDDLDSDDDDVVESLLKRINGDLATLLYTNKNELKVFPVSSIDPQKLKDPEAQSYAKKIPDVRRALGEILFGAKERLIAFSSAKVAKQVAQITEQVLEKQIQPFEREIVLLHHQRPDDPEGFKDEVFSHIFGQWNAIEQFYISQIHDELTQAEQSFFDGVVRGLQNCSDREQIKQFLQKRLKRFFSSYFHDVQEARKRVWQKISDQMAENLSEYLQAIYAELPFHIVAQKDAWKLELQPVSLQEFNRFLGEISEKFSNADAAGWGGAMAGAAIGALFGGPIGAVIGGALGGFFGGAVGEDIIQGVLNGVEQEFVKYKDQLIQVLVLDVESADPEQPPLLKLEIARFVEQERKKFDLIVVRRLHELEQKRTIAFQQSRSLRALLVEAMNWHHTFDTTLRNK